MRRFDDLLRSVGREERCTELAHIRLACGVIDAAACEAEIANVLEQLAKLKSALFISQIAQSGNKWRRLRADPCCLGTPKPFSRPAEARSATRPYYFTRSGALRFSRGGDRPLCLAEARSDTAMAQILRPFGVSRGSVRVPCLRRHIII